MSDSCLSSDYIVPYDSEFVQGRLGVIVLLVAMDKVNTKHNFFDFDPEMVVGYTCGNALRPVQN